MIKQELIDEHEKVLDDYDLHKSASTTYSRAYEYICVLEEAAVAADKLVTRLELNYQNKR